MIDYIKNPGTWVTILAVIISIIALFQTSRQTKLSNKQQLFDRRLEKYLFLKDLLILYKKNRFLFAENKNICENVEDPFLFITNCAILENMGVAISTPLAKESHKDYLTKIEMIDKYATEIELLWNTNEGRLAGRFVREYKDLIHSMYKQQISINHLKNSYTQEKPPFLDEYQRQVREEADKTGLLAAIKRIDTTYNEIVEKDVEDTIIKSICL